MDITDSRIKLITNLAKLREAIAEGEKTIQKLDVFDSELDGIKRMLFAKRLELVASWKELVLLKLTIEKDFPDL